MKFQALFCFTLISSTLLAQTNSFSSVDAADDLTPERTCATHDLHVQMMGLQRYAEAVERVEEHTAHWSPIIEAQRAAGQNVVITIPVVFHVLYSNSTENIPDERIFEQMQILNDDFRRTNSDQDNIWSQAADTEFEFCLATYDPNGAPTNGILRVPTTVASFGSNNAMKFSSQGGSDAWPATDYLNFWVCNLGGGLLGYAQFPASMATDAATDGVVCGYPFVGIDGPNAAPYNLGRTATHEVGHWLNLRHIWGDGPCGQDDLVTDTPESDAANFGCAIGHVSCSTEDMVQNYMDYSEDACMNLFTAGQATRMQALFAPGGLRESILSSGGCAPPCEVDCGCTNDAACNFDPAAINDDGSCDFSCNGCTDPSACNYSPDAIFDDGSCELPAPNCNCDSSTDVQISATLAANEQSAPTTFTATGNPIASNMDITLVFSGGGASWAADMAMTITDAAGTCVTFGGYNSFPTGCANDLGNYQSVWPSNWHIQGGGTYSATVNLSSAGLSASGDWTVTLFNGYSTGETVTYDVSFTLQDVCPFSGPLQGCTDPTACNYNPDAVVDNGSCETLDACGVCGGPGAIYDCGCTGIPAGDCDCNGTQIDALGVCGGSCTADADSDGICDDVDACVGQLDALGICNGDCQFDLDGDGVCDEVIPPTEPCVNGFAGIYPCNQVDLMSHMGVAEVGGGEMNDIWGWTDPLDGKEYALLGKTNGTAFIDISNPIAPVLLGTLPPHTNNSIWRDIKVYDNHAFIVSEASGHGMQVFDLTRLRNVANPPVTFTEDGHYGGFGNAHNIVINEASGRAYGVGTGTYSGGLHILDISTPTAPVLIGSFANDGYTHDAQVVNYIGPDAAYAGKEIAFCFNENTVTIVDVTDPTDATQISATGYANSAYTHQGWLTEDHKYLLVNDELDEQNFGGNTRTYIFDVQDLNNVTLIGTHSGATAAIDHNLYTHEGLVYQSNYRAGLRILDLDNVAQGQLEEVAFFDVYPASNSAQFNGTWSNYPYFGSGNVIVSHIEEGLYVLRPNIIPPCLQDCGCTDPTACNFDPNALNDDGTCDFSCYGCTDPNACNYDAAATLDDGSCVAPDPLYGCECSLDGQIVTTLSGGQVSAPLQVAAIGNPAASTIDITLAFTGGGSSWPADMAVAITDGNGNCVSFGGFNTSPAGCNSLGNYQTIWPSGWSSATSGTYTATVNLSAGNLTGSGTWSIVVQNGWGAGGAVTYGMTFSLNDVCPDEGNPDVPGCTDAAACNYDPGANLDDGSCLYLDALGVCGGDCPADVDQDGVCDTNEVPGCTDPAAENYDPNATDEDGSCTYPAPCPGDFDGDGLITVSDVLVALGDFGCNGICQADLDEDGITGVTDILEMLSSFGDPCP